VNLADLDGTDVFLTKNPAWSYEKEWRMIIPLVEPDRMTLISDEQIYLYKMPSSVIVEIILGAKLKTNSVNEIKDIISSNSSMRHIKIKRASISDEKAAIELTDL
ncbi:MAG: hypothetical protein ACREHG_08775, partial [Candidatus Saccharimonadales bacterium]